MTSKVPTDASLLIYPGGLWNFDLCLFVSYAAIWHTVTEGEFQLGILLAGGCRSLTCLTFALHESVRAAVPQRFIDVDRVTSRGPNAFNYNTLLPNKSNLLLHLLLFYRRLFAADATATARFEGQRSILETPTYFMTELCVILNSSSDTFISFSTFFFRLNSFIVSSLQFSFY